MVDKIAFIEYLQTHIVCKEVYTYAQNKIIIQSTFKV